MWIWEEKKEPIAFDKYKYNVVGQYPQFNILDHLIFSIFEKIFVSWCWAYNSASSSTVQGLHLWTTLVRLINIVYEDKNFVVFIHNLELSFWYNHKKDNMSGFLCFFSYF